jgi:hypothetical protein
MNFLSKLEGLNFKLIGIKTTTMSTRERSAMIDVFDPIVPV